MLFTNPFDTYLRASLVAQTVKNLPAMQEIWVESWVMEIPWRREGLPTLVFLPWEFHGQRSLAGLWVTQSRTQLSESLQYSCLENSMDREAWQVCGSHRVGHSWVTHFTLRSKYHCLRIIDWWLIMNWQLKTSFQWIWF